MSDLAIILLREDTSFGCAGPMFLEEAEDLAECGDLDKYDYWRIIDLRSLMHTTSAKLVVRDKWNIAEMEREQKKKRKGA